MSWNKNVPPPKKKLLLNKKTEFKWALLGLWLSNAEPTRVGWNKIKIQVGSLSKTIQSLAISQNLFIRIVTVWICTTHTHTHTHYKAQNYLLRSVRLLNNSKTIYRMFKQYMTACSMHKVTSLCKHVPLNVCFSNCSPSEEKETQCGFKSLPRDTRFTPRHPPPPMLKHCSITAYQNYASVAAEESYNPQCQLTKTRWISFLFFFFFYCKPTLTL